MAGGLTIQADREEINLARILNTDGEHIKIKFKEFEPKRAANFISLKPEQKSQAQAKNNSNSQNKSKSKSAKREKVYEKVNINTAGLDELTKLKGIGPALAQRILDYRNSNGSFKSVQDLKKVRGIGDAKLKALKDQVIL
ncbi:MAG: helix-hairpin-helix domain-containing protein [Synergistaceae bacterium]|nr:helix-hairpin-helix domain-containing protein [Synergistaceae bacterium]